MVCFVWYVSCVARGAGGGCGQVQSYAALLWNHAASARIRLALADPAGDARPSTSTGTQSDPRECPPPVHTDPAHPVAALAGLRARVGDLVWRADPALGLDPVADPDPDPAGAEGEVESSTEEKLQVCTAAAAESIASTTPGEGTSESAGTRGAGAAANRPLTPHVMPHRVTAEEAAAGMFALQV
jgi:hypothetical protein